MKKLATVLALVAMTAGSLVATEGVSFAAIRHGKRPVPTKSIVARKKAHKGFEDGPLFARRVKGRKKIRRHRKIPKTPSDPGMGSVSESSMTG